MLLDMLLSEVDPFDGSHRDPSVLCKVIFCGRITIIPDPQLPDPGAFSSFQDLLKAYVLAIYRAAADLTPMTEDYRQAELALLWKQWCSQPVIPKHCHCPCWLIPDGTVSSQDAESHSNYNLIKVPTLKVATLNSRSLIRLPALPPIFFFSLLADQIKWIAPLLCKVGVISTKGQPVICSHNVATSIEKINKHTAAGWPITIDSKHSLHKSDDMIPSVNQVQALAQRVLSELLAGTVGIDLLS